MGSYTPGDETVEDRTIVEPPSHTDVAPAEGAGADQIRHELLRFLTDEIGLRAEAIRDETLLFSSGLVDSFSLVALVMFIESQWSFRVDPMDITLENVDSLGRITGYVARSAASRPA